MSISSERLKELRKEKNITQKELSERTDISLGVIKKYESGRTPSRKHINIEKLASFYNVYPEWIFGSGYKNDKEEFNCRYGTDTEYTLRRNRLYHNIFIKGRLINALDKFLNMDAIEKKYLPYRLRKLITDDNWNDFVKNLKKEDYNKFMIYNNLHSGMMNDIINYTHERFEQFINELEKVKGDLK